jgi:hypothetical protein
MSNTIDANGDAVLIITDLENEEEQAVYILTPEQLAQVKAKFDIESDCTGDMVELKDFLEGEIADVRMVRGDRETEFKIKNTSSVYTFWYFG